jgi:hypothetical protein
MDNSALERNSHRRRGAAIDTSFNDVATPDINQFYQQYQENMRLYQNNISHIVRHLNSVRPPTTTTTHRPDRRRNNSGIHNSPFYGIFTGGGSSDSYDIPTINQFALAVEYSNYDRETMTNTRVCPITLDEFHDSEQICRIKHCRHIFKTNALQNWLSRNAHCPVCRFDIRRQPSSNV